MKTVKEFREPGEDRTRVEFEGIQRPYQQVANIEPQRGGQSERGQQWSTWQGMFPDSPIVVLSVCFEVRLAFQSRERDAQSA